MARSNIKAVFANDVQTVWNIVTDVKNYIWRTDLSKTEIISDKQFIEYTKAGLILYLPCIVNTLEFTKKFQYMLGHYMFYSTYIEKSEFNATIQLCLLFNQKLSDEYREILCQLHINYEERLVDVD